MSERSTYYAWRGNGITDLSLLSEKQISGSDSGYSVPVQVADLSKGERVVSAEDMELIRAEVTAKIMEQYPAMQYGVAKVATTAIDLFWTRLTEGRE